MARKSAVLTPEGKKAALAQLKNTAKEAGVNVKNAKAAHTAAQKAQDAAVRAHTKAIKGHISTLAKADKELVRAKTKLEIAQKSLEELKATAVTPVAKPAKAPVLTPPASSALTAGTSVQ